jgi:hypothetical protein
MRTIHFIPVILFMGLVACNNAGDKAAGGSDTTAASATDTSMAHMPDSAAKITALPDVPAGAKVFFKNLKDGQTVSSPVKVEMGVEGIKLDSAGAIVAGSGHHHLLVDAGDSIASGQVVPKDSTHYHYGKAQTSAEIKLAPGEHTLTLQFGDGIHRSYGAKLAATIKVKVK